MNMKKIKEFITMVVIIGIVTFPGSVWDIVMNKIKHQEEHEKFNLQKKETEDEYR